MKHFVTCDFWSNSTINSVLPIANNKMCRVQLIISNYTDGYNFTAGPVKLKIPIDNKDNYWKEDNGMFFNTVKS